MAFFITTMKGEVKMENRLRGNHDLVYCAREGLPDGVKRLYEAMGHLVFSKKMYPQLLGKGMAFRRGRCVKQS